MRSIIRIIIFMSFISGFLVYGNDRCYGALTIYCWKGAGTGSNLANEQFVPKWKNVLNAGSNTVIIEIHPRRERIKEMMKAANILYASTHSGIPKKADEQGLQVGPDGTEGNVLPASEIAMLNSRKPALIIINGCCTFPLLSEEQGKCRNIATALGIKEGTKGRTYLGFKGGHPGPKGDDYFRVFFYFWSGAGGKNLTVAKALDEARDYIEKFVKEQGGDTAQKYLLSIGAANCRKDIEILGDPNLRYSDLKP